jgi:hypothetical protein
MAVGMSHNDTGEGWGEGEYTLWIVFPSLPLCGIPDSLIFEKGCGTVSSPLWGEEI